MPEQLEIQLNKTREATPEEYQEWRKSDYWNRMDFDPLIMFVLIPSLIQFSALALMFTSFWLISQVFSA